jgi:SnoaL-like domain
LGDEHVAQNSYRRRHRARGRRRYASRGTCAATSKPQFVWNQQEREAVEVVKSWVDAWSNRNAQRMAQHMAENTTFRASPAEPLQQGRAAFVTAVSRSVADVSRAEIEEIFVTGAEWDTTVLIKRVDYPPRTAGEVLPWPHSSA